MKTLIPKSISGFEALLGQPFKQHRFAIDCAKMPGYDDYHRNNGNKGNLTDLFKSLARIKTPVIYWFEFDAAVYVPKQLKLVEQYRKKQKRLSKKSGRVVPLPNSNGAGKVFYVGKRLGGSAKDGFTHASGRIEMHLGYNTNCANQGLQLCHWCEAQLTLNIIQLPRVAGRYLTIIEQLFAIELTPRLGRH